MAHDQFSAHSFDPTTLSILYAAFDSAWKKVELSTDARNKEAVRNAVALAIVDRAKTGQRDPVRLATYAIARAYPALYEARVA